MKAYLFSLLGFLFFSSIITAQTAGTLTFTFTEVAQPTNSCYNRNAQHVLAVWIQTGSGAFVKTKLRYVGSGTNDHLPTWASQASCTSGNAVSSGCNILDATTGATRSSWTTYTITWDGKKGAPTTGVLQADGTYKVVIQSTWNHGTSGTRTSSYSFTKGPSTDHQTPAADASFSNITLDWQPTITGVNEMTHTPSINIYPNPTNGVLNIDYTNGNNIKIYNTLGVLVYDEQIEQEGIKSIDLRNFSNGVYIVSVSNNDNSIFKKIFLEK